LHGSQIWSLNESLEFDLTLEVVPGSLTVLQRFPGLACQLLKCKRGDILVEAHAEVIHKHSAYIKNNLLI